MKILFKLNRPSNETTSLMVVIQIGKGRFVRSTGLLVSSEGWDQARQKHKERHVNQLLREIERKYETFLTTIVGKEIDPIKALKEFSLPDKPKEEPEEETVLKWADSRNLISDRIRANFPAKLTFDQMTMQWWDGWIAGLRRKGLSLNYVDRLNRDWKKLMRRAYEEGIHNNKVYEHSRMKVGQEEAPTVYLSLDELRKIREVELPDYYDNARRLFLLGAYTGLRFSDFTRLRDEDFVGDFIDIRNQKTGERVVIPISRAAREIASNGLPRNISNQKFNYYIKEICKRAGIDSMVSWGRTQGTRRESRVVEKWTLVTSHTARRSFATNLYLSGIDILSIMKFTGHRTPQSFMKYIRIGKIETAERLKEQISNLF